MTTRKFMCLHDNAQFTEQEAARLCVHCNEPYSPQAGQISRCSSCGAEGECADGRLDDSGYRCPSCAHEGGAEMLDGPLACPYCLNAVERPEAARPKSVQQVQRVGVQRVGVRRLGQIAAVGLCVVGTLAAAYELAPQVIQRWDDLSRAFPIKHLATKNIEPTVEQPSPIKVSQPLEPSQSKPDPRVLEVPDQPIETAQSQPMEQQNPAEPPAQVPQPGNPSAGASNQPLPIQKPAVQVAPPIRVAPPVIVSFTSSTQSI